MYEESCFHYPDMALEQNWMAPDLSGIFTSYIKGQVFKTAPLLVAKFLNCKA